VSFSRQMFVVAPLVAQLYDGGVRYRWGEKIGGKTALKSAGRRGCESNRQIIGARRLPKF
jgi:hypothetical protein